MSTTNKLVPIVAMLGIMLANMLLGIPDGESWTITRLFYILLSGVVAIISVTIFNEYQSHKNLTRQYPWQTTSSGYSSPPHKPSVGMPGPSPSAGPAPTTSSQPDLAPELIQAHIEYQRLQGSYAAFEQVCNNTGVKMTSTIVLTKTGIDALIGSATSSQELALLKQGISDLEKYVIETTSKIEAITTRLENIADRLGAFTGTSHEEDAMELGLGLQTDGFMSLLDQEQWQSANDVLDQIDDWIEDKEQELGQQEREKSTKDELQEAYDLFGLVPPYELKVAKKIFRDLALKYNPGEAGITQQEQTDRTKMMQKINPAKDLIWKTHGWT